jgi:hypothetical protein
MHLPLTGLDHYGAFAWKKVPGMVKQMSAKIWKNRENIRVYGRLKLRLRIQTVV